MRPKYITVKTPVTRDLAECHMQGDIMLGSTLRHVGGKTRVLRWEADTYDCAEQLKAAAVALAQSGARPLLEDSLPVDHPGGVHLVVIFDGLINVEAAHATAHHWAPSLRDIAEQWPKGTARVHLPAGRFHRKEVDGWCDVWSVGGIKKTGSAAFELLTTHQTPATWITVKPPVKPVPKPGVHLAPTVSHGRWLPPTEHIPYRNRDKHVYSSRHRRIAARLPYTHQASHLYPSRILFETLPNAGRSVILPRQPRRPRTEVFDPVTADDWDRRADLSHCLAREWGHRPMTICATHRPGTLPSA